MVNAVKSSKSKSNLHQIDCFSSMRSHQALQASALVGRQVLVNHESFWLKNEGDVIVAVDLPLGLTHLMATIQTKSCEIIKVMEWEPIEYGLFKFSWDGRGQTNERLRPDQYQIKVSGIQNGQKIVLKTMIVSNVDSVSLGKNGKNLKLNVAGVGLTSLDLLKFI